MNESFDTWYQEFVGFLVSTCGFTQEFIDTFDKNSYRKYYDKGLTALEAIAQEFNYNNT